MVWPCEISIVNITHTEYPKKYAHGFVVLCFVVVMQSFIMNSHEVFIHIHQGCFAGTGAIVRLPQCQWSKPGGYGKISQCMTTTKHSKAKTVCIFLEIYCSISIACQDNSVTHAQKKINQVSSKTWLHIQTQQKSCLFRVWIIYIGYATSDTRLHHAWSVWYYRSPYTDRD